MKLTSSEKQLILKNRAEEEKDLPKLTGFLKENLYVINQQKVNFPWLVNESEKKDIISKFESIFELALPAGSEFVAFIEDDGFELWYDNHNYGIEAMSSEWAKTNLVNIKKYVKNKKRTKSK